MSSKNKHILEYITTSIKVRTMLAIEYTFQIKQVLKTAYVDGILDCNEPLLS